MRYTAKDTPIPAPEREDRMIPSGRWASTLGVKRYDRVAPFGGVITDPERVELPLGRHIGLPSIPSVASGDTVSRGDVVAQAANGLSVPQHAPIGGRVTVSENKIIISRIRYDV